MDDYIPAHRFTVASVDLDANGHYWVHYLGDQINQGGVSFGWDSAGSCSIDAVLAVLKIQLEKHQEEHLRLITKKMTNE